MIRKSLFLLLITVLSNSLLSQYSYNYRLYTINDGLIVNACEKLLQDSKGYLYISNGNGITRYNGKSFVNSIDKESTAWYGLQLLELRQKGSKSRVIANGGEFTFDFQSGTLSRADSNLWLGFIYGKEDLGWITQNGLVDKAGYKVFALKKSSDIRGKSRRAIDTLYFLNKNELGFCLFPGPKKVKQPIYSYQLADSQNNLFVILVDSSRNNYAAYKFENGSLKYLFNTNKFIKKIEKDLKGNYITVNREEDEITLINPKGQIVIQNNEAKFGNILVAPNGDFWIATDFGLMKISDGKISKYQDNDRKLKRVVKHLYETGKDFTAETTEWGNYKFLVMDKNGFIINGDRIFDGNQFSDLLETTVMSGITKQETTSGTNKIITDMLCDRENNIWMATTEGLIKFTPVPYRLPKDYLSKNDFDYKLKYTDLAGRKYFVKSDELAKVFYLKIYRDTALLWSKKLNGLILNNSYEVEDMLRFASCGDYGVVFYSDIKKKQFVHFFSEREEKKYEFPSTIQLVLSNYDTLVCKGPMSYQERRKPDCKHKMFQLNANFLREREISPKLYDQLESVYFQSNDGLIFGPPYIKKAKKMEIINNRLTRLRIKPDLSIDTAAYAGLPASIRYNFIKAGRVDYGSYHLFLIDKKSDIFLCTDESYIKLKLNGFSGDSVFKFFDYSSQSYFSVKILKDLVFASEIYGNNQTVVFRIDTMNLSLDYLCTLSYKNGLPGRINTINCTSDFAIISSEDSREILILSYDEFIKDKLSNPVKIRISTNPAIFFNEYYQADSYNYFKDILNKSFFNRQAPLIDIDLQVPGESAGAALIDDEGRRVIPANSGNLSFEYDVVSFSEGDFVQVKYNILGLDSTWQMAGSSPLRFPSLPPGTYTLQIKACNNHNFWSDPGQFAFAVDYPWYRTWTAYGGYLLLGFGSLFGFIRIRTNQLEKEKRKLEQVVKDRTAEISEQKHLIEEKNKEITDSINYAQKIQSTLMASDKLLSNFLRDQKSGRDYFVFYQPKDIVSGDYYWAYDLPDGEFILITADCTGHGVPGAFMSLLCISYLNEIVKEQKIIQPNQIFNQVREKIVNNFRADENPERKDGMDAVLCKFNFSAGSIEYAAGNNPVIVVEPDSEGMFSLKELEYDKMPVGVSHNSEYPPFKNFRLNLKKGSVVYTFTDGFADQFGGPKGKKFMYKKLRDLILANAALELEEQKSRLKEAISDWKGDNEQVDDICVIGIRV
jgi:serine phosphatase RsbU (regulator of sigma subunit)